MTVLFGRQFAPNLPQLDPLDSRLNIFRDDLADIRLRAKVKADQYVEGISAQICASLADVKSAPDISSITIHQMLLGEELLIFERSGEYAWVQAKIDGYTGYVRIADIVEVSEPLPASHVVDVPRTFQYPEAELRSPPLRALSLGCRVDITGYGEKRGTRYALLSDGSAIIESHLRPLPDLPDDYVSYCEKMIHTPYLWGGSSGFGIDCSSLVQLPLRMCGINVLRDSDMQAASTGSQIDPGKDCRDLKRGDLVFWKGHVAICCGFENGEIEIIHASGHTMSVAREPLREAIERIAYLYEMPIGFRRP